MLSGKQFPQNIQALRMLPEKILHEMPQQDEVQSMDTFQAHLDHLSGLSQICDRHYHSCYALMMKFVRTERETEFPHYLKVVIEYLKYVFIAGNIKYAQYGVSYLCQMDDFPDDIQKRFKKGDHTIHLKSEICNGIW